MVTDVSLAPDGMVTCSASNDGLVKFWDTSALVEDKQDGEMKILHEWYPHDKAPVSCIRKSYKKSLKQIDKSDIF